MSAPIKQIVRRFLNAFATADVATLEAIVAPDVVDHNPPPGQTGGRQALIDAVKMYRAAFPDMTITIENEIVEGDLVAVNGTVIGTNDGPMMGMPATHKKVGFAYMDMYRVSNGQIRETWHVEDVAGMLKQMEIMR
jgi:steroid delta-isomerase-like uncharacterized protein